jgi:hypothetical protein
MTFNAQIPQPNNLISNSQSDILQNFQFLGSTTGNTFPGFYKFPNGLILQWGDTGVLTAGTVLLTYAQLGMLTFTSTCFFVIPVILSTTIGHTAAIEKSEIKKDHFAITTDGLSVGCRIIALGV